jgi:hypothetical protein
VSGLLDGGKEGPDEPGADRKMVSQVRPVVRAPRREVRTPAEGRGLETVFYLQFGHARIGICMCECVCVSNFFFFFFFFLPGIPRKTYQEKQKQTKQKHNPKTHVLGRDAERWLIDPARERGHRRRARCRKHGVQLILEPRAQESGEGVRVVIADDPRAWRSLWIDVVVGRRRHPRGLLGGGRG